MNETPPHPKGQGILKKMVKEKQGIIKCNGTLIIATYKEKGKKDRCLGGKLTFTQDKKELQKIKLKYKKELKTQLIKELNSEVHNSSQD